MNKKKWIEMFILNIIKISNQNMFALVQVVESRVQSLQMLDFKAAEANR